MHRKTKPREIDHVVDISSPHWFWHDLGQLLSMDAYLVQLFKLDAYTPPQIHNCLSILFLLWMPGG